MKLDKNRIIYEKTKENLMLRKELDKLENECDRYFIIEENIEKYINEKIEELYYKIKELEYFLIKIATTYGLLINKKNVKNIKNDNIGTKLLNSKSFDVDDNKVILFLNEKEDIISTRVDLIGLFNFILKMKENIKYRSSLENLEILKTYNNYLNQEIESYKVLKYLIDNNLIHFESLDELEYYKKNMKIIEQVLNDMKDFSSIFMESIHLDILIGKNFNLIEEKEEISKLNLKYIICLCRLENEYDIDLFTKVYIKDLNKIKVKKL